MKPPAKLVQFHGVIVDLVYHIEAVPAPGGEAYVKQFEINAGGGFNAMVSAKRSGMAVAYAGSLGTGPFSEVVNSALISEGIDHLRPRDKARDQGCCTVMIDNTGERTFVAAEGAEGYLSAADLRSIQLSNLDWSILSGYTLYYEGSGKVLTDWLLRAETVPSLVFDPSPIIGKVPAKAIEAALARVSWVSANSNEAAILTGESDPSKAAEHLSKGRSGGSVVRTGSKGCIVSYAGNNQWVPGHPVTIIDTNGAGDTHIGAFIACLANGQSPIDAARYANVAAALSTKRNGSATAPERDEIEATLRSLETQ